MKLWLQQAWKTIRDHQVSRMICDHPFALVAAGYAAVVVACWCWLWGWPAQPQDRDYVAARELVNNHRIVSGDLRRPATLAGSLGFYVATAASIEGKYVNTTKPSIMPGESVRTVALLDRPNMELPENMRAAAFPLPSGSRIIGMLEVGSPVVLVGQDTEKVPVSIPATVHAIICGSTKSDTESCYPILRIPAEQSHVVMKNQAALHLALRSKLQALEPEERILE
jgi:hypothetical protein